MGVGVHTFSHLLYMELSLIRFHTYLHVIVIDKILHVQTLSALNVIAYLPIRGCWKYFDNKHACSDTGHVAGKKRGSNEECYFNAGTMSETLASS